MGFITIKFPGGDTELTFPADKFVSVYLLRKEAMGQPALDITLAGAPKPQLIDFCDNEEAEGVRHQILEAVRLATSDGRHREVTWENKKASEEA